MLHGNLGWHRQRSDQPRPERCCPDPRAIDGLQDRLDAPVRRVRVDGFALAGAEVDDRACLSGDRADRPDHAAGGVPEHVGEAHASVGAIGICVFAAIASDEVE